MARIRRGRVDRSWGQQQSQGGTYSFGQFLVILLGIFVIIFNLKSVLEHEKGELRLRIATVQTKESSLDQTLIDQIVENAAQKVASKATSQIDQHLNAFSQLMPKENSERLNTENNDAGEKSLDGLRNKVDGSDDRKGQHGFESKDWPKRKPRIPNVLVAGVQRGATTSLTKYLVDQFDACSHKTDRMFWAQEQLNATSYESLYSKCTTDKIFVDGSPETIMYPTAVKKLYEEDGSIDDLKIIVTLREPVERELSSYSYRRSQLEKGLGGTDLVKKDDTVRDFTEDVRDRLLQDFRRQNVKALYGTYADQLTNWFEMFDRQQILILSFTELQRNETDYLDRVHSFLSLPPRRPEQEFPVEAKAEHEPEKTENLCKFMNFVGNRFFRTRNLKLQELLQNFPGPAMEQTPFPQFEVQCTPD